VIQQSNIVSDAQTLDVFLKSPCQRRRDIDGVCEDCGCGKAGGVDWVFEA
jgi:hypothetical protein